MTEIYSFELQEHTHAHISQKHSSQVGHFFVEVGGMVLSRLFIPKCFTCFTQLKCKTETFCVQNNEIAYSNNVKAHTDFLCDPFSKMHMPYLSELDQQT